MVFNNDIFLQVLKVIWSIVFLMYLVLNKYFYELIFKLYKYIFPHLCSFVIASY